MESRKDKARLILQPPIWKGVRLCGSSHVERRASSTKTDQPSANSSRRRSDLFTKTLVLPCSHCFRQLDLLTSTSGVFHALAYVFLTSMIFRERRCSFEVFRMNFVPMLCVNIQKTCLRQLGRQEQLAGARISRLVAKGMRLQHRILPKSPREWIIDGKKLDQAEREQLKREGRCFKCRKDGICPRIVLSATQTPVANEPTGAVIGERRSACACV